MPESKVGAQEIHAGHVVQVQRLQDTDQFSTTATIPVNTTIPQNNEGALWNSLPITPKSSSNILLIDVKLMMANGNAEAWSVAALFKDSESDARAVAVNMFFRSAAGSGGNASLNFSYSMIAGSTSLITFKVRLGTSTSTLRINNTGQNDQYWGSASGLWPSSITIMEIKV